MTMPPQRFEIGQAVTPKINMEWPICTTVGINGVLPLPPPERVSLPRQGEIYHVSGYQAYDDRIWGIFLSEYIGQNLTFAEPNFDPVELTTSDITALMEETIPEEV